VGRDDGIEEDAQHRARALPAHRATQAAMMNEWPDRLWLREASFLRWAQLVLLLLILWRVW
jgi:hypothetical protein